MIISFLSANWPEPWKYITFPKDAGLKLVTGSDGETVTITSTYPIKGLILDVADRSTDAKDGEVEWSDQALDLMPGDEQVVVAKGLKGRELAARVSLARTCCLQIASLNTLHTLHSTLGMARQKRSEVSC